MRNPILLGLIALSSFFAFSAPALEPSKIETEQGTVELLSEREVAAPAATQWLGIYFKPKPGWHVYWKNPGDSGLPPRAEFSSRPNGSEFGELEFPTPSRIPYGPLMNFGYEGDVLYPVKWTAPESVESGDSVTVTANLKWLICKEECVPGRAKLSLRLPVETFEKFESTQGTHSALFKSTTEALPVVETDKVRVAIVEGKDGKDAIEIHYSGTVSRSAYRSVVFFPEGEYGIASDVKVQAEGVEDGIRVQIPRKEKKPLGEVRGVLKLEPGRGVFVSEIINPNLLPKDYGKKKDRNAVSTSWETLPWMLLFAFIGGLILNLMPCILPVLSIKVMEIASQGGSRAASIRKHGWVYTFGILVSFWILAGILIGLRASGKTLGWGFQLQSPTFVAALSILFFLMGLNLFGFFEIGGRLMGVGGKLASRDGYSGSFFTGVLTTVAATPCSAPFMGTALGFALTQSAFVATVVLSFLGLGLAFPYLVFSYLPAAARILPRPGPWMKTMKEFLSFPLFATVAWLLSVLGNQAGVDAVFHVLFALILMTASIWFFGLQNERTIPKMASRLLGLISVVIAFGLLQGLGAMRTEAMKERSDKSPLVHEPWKEWSSKLLEQSLKEKKTVIVNLTADWCVTCKVNEALVFERPVIKKVLSEEGIVPLLGDWTNGDPAITSYMMKYGRNSVPVYLLYKNGTREPKILPQILSVDLVLKELR